METRLNRLTLQGFWAEAEIMRRFEEQEVLGKKKENYNLKKDDTVVIRSRWSNLLVIPEFVKNRDFLKSMIYNNSVNTTNLTNDVVDNKRSE